MGVPAVNGTGPKTTWVPKGSIARPKDGKHFIACLVGGYRDTRLAIERELMVRYGIWCKRHFGLERAHDPGPIEIANDVEIVVVLTDDVKKMLPKVLKACEKAKIEHIGISRKKRYEWDTTFALRGFPNPPKWRDGIDIDKVLGPETLDHIEEPRMAYEDPKLREMREQREAEARIEAQLRADAAPPPPPLPPPPTPKAGPVNFGKIITECREKKSWDKAKLAEEIGITTGGVDQWERGKVKAPMYEQYLRLRELFPDFPVMKNLRGEAVYKKRHKDDPPKGVIRVPAPAPYVPPTIQGPAAAAPTPPAAAPVPTPPAHVTSHVVTGDPLSELRAVVDELKAFDEDVKLRRAALEARMDAIYQLVKGR